MFQRWPPLMGPACRDDVALNCIQRNSDRGAMWLGNASVGRTGQKRSTLNIMEHLRISCAKRVFLLREIYGMDRDTNATYVKH